MLEVTYDFLVISGQIALEPNVTSYCTTFAGLHSNPMQEIFFKELHNMMVPFPLFVSTPLDDILFLFYTINVQEFIHANYYSMEISIPQFNKTKS